MWKIKNATNVFEYVLKIVLRNVSQKSLKRYLYEALFYLVGEGGGKREDGEKLKTVYALGNSWF